ncbi:MAG TPA: hypothetical protein VFP49_10875 [Nitrososphaeraceae archaeon]|nr:hypothetical protein [Nitrososphaeraceae archaeon]
MEEAIAATAIKITVFVQEGLRLARGLLLAQDLSWKDILKLFGSYKSSRLVGWE